MTLKKLTALINRFLHFIDSAFTLFVMLLLPLVRLQLLGLRTSMVSFAGHVRAFPPGELLSGD